MDETRILGTDREELTFLFCRHGVANKNPKKSREGGRSRVEVEELDTGWAT